MNIEEIEPTMNGMMQFTIQSKLNMSMVLAIEGNNAMQGAQLITQENYGTLNQSWLYVDGYIQSSLNGLVLSIEGSNETHCADVLMMEKHGGENQKWTLAANEQIINNFHGLALDIADASTEAGGRIIAAPPNSGKNQKWMICEPFTIQSTTSNLFLGIQNSSPAEGARVATTRSANPSCYWIFRDGFIQNCMNDFVLDVKEANPLPNAEIIVWSKNRESNQRWSFSSEGYIVSESIGYVLNYFKEQVVEGVPLVTSPRNNVPSQKWKITKSEFQEASKFPPEETKKFAYRTRGPAKPSGSSSTFTSLNARNLSQTGVRSTLSSTLGVENVNTGNSLNDALPQIRRSQSYQDSVASSLAHFDVTAHASDRMEERNVSKREISRVIKYGRSDYAQGGAFVVGLDDLVVVLALEDYNGLKNRPINDILSNIELEGESWKRSSKKVITVYRVNPEISSLNPDPKFRNDKFSTWWKLYLHISSTLPTDNDNPHQPVEEPSWRDLEVMLEDARCFHGEENFRKVLNWVRPTNRREDDPNFGVAKSFEITLLARACVYGFPNIVRILRQYGADPLKNNTHARHRCTPLQSMFTSDRLFEIPWRTSMSDVDTIHALLDPQYTTSEVQNECINGIYHDHSTFKRAVYFGDQLLVDCLLEYNCVDLTIHDNDGNDEPISLVAKYGGIRITLDKSLPVEVFHPKLQMVPEGYSILSVNEIPKKFKLRVTSTNGILGLRNWPDCQGRLSREHSFLRQLIHCETDNRDFHHVPWSEIVMSTDQPANMWGGLSGAIEQQWVRIFLNQNAKSPQSQALTHSPEFKDEFIQARPYSAGGKRFSLWAPCTNTTKGNQSTFRFYSLPTTELSANNPNGENNLPHSHFVIIGQSLNERHEKDEFALTNGSFLCYLDEMLVYHKCPPSQATVFEIIPIN